MRTSWKIGTAFGIGVYVNITFLLLPLMVLWQGWGRNNVQALIFSLVLLFAVFGCVVLHEFGHALMARYFGIRTRDITLYPIGGVASLEGMGSRPIEEFCIALAGPAVNFVIAAFLGVLTALFYGLSTLTLEPNSLMQASAMTVEVFLANLLLMNLGLAGFNLLPIFPMDGGRVLRSLLAMSLGQLRATEIAAQIGLLAAFVGLGLAYKWDKPMLALVALFILFAGQKERMIIRQRELFRRRQLVDVLPGDEDMPAVAPGTVRPGFSGYTYDQRLNAMVLWTNGRPTAYYSLPKE